MRDGERAAAVDRGSPESTRESEAVEILRGMILHTPRNAFTTDDALEAYDDGGLAVADGRVVAVGPFAEVRRAHPRAAVRDLRGGVILPGFVDAHVHFPQLRRIGALGYTLLTWLREVALPEEARLVDAEYARKLARVFLRALLRNGTTTALVFGAHFPAAQAALFEEAEALGYRLTSGMVLSDRLLQEPLHQSPERAYEACRKLIHRFHGRGRLRYAVTPRFALSTSEAMLAVAQGLLAEAEGLYVQTHLNETREEIEEVLRLFPGAGDYLAVYERFGLVHERAVFAHNVHPCQAELERLRAARAAVAHCPSSNAFLGSGIFPLRRHLACGVRVALGSDVGGGTGFSLLKEALACYELQRLHPEGVPLTAAQLLYLATRAGAEALGLGEEIGDLRPGKAADAVYLRPPAGSTLAAVLEGADGPEEVLGALVTLAREESVAEVFVAGQPMLARLAEEGGP